MARICAAIRPVLTGRGILFWLLLCALAVSTDRVHAASFTPSQSSSKVYSGETPVLRVHGSHCDWRVGRDARVGYAHNHRHVEACQDSTSSEKTLETFDRHDKRTSTRKTAGERDRERRRNSSADGHKADDHKTDDSKADNAKTDNVKTDNSKADARDSDEKEAAVSPRIEERRERPRCNTRGGYRNRECDAAPPPPYIRESREGPPDDEPDKLTRARCGMLCMWRRAKYGHCGVGCSYYRRRYDNEGYGDWRRRNRDDYSGEGDRDILK